MLFRSLAGLALRETLGSTTYLIAHETPVSFGAMFRLFRSATPGARGTAMFAGTVLGRVGGLLAPVLPMKVRSLFEDYYVCDPVRLGRDGLGLPRAWDAGLRQSLVDGRWFE